MELNKYKKNNHHHNHNLKSRSNPTNGDQDPHYATSFAFQITALAVHILTLGADGDDSLANGVLGPSHPRFLALSRF